MIRTALESDTEVLLEMGKAMHHESPRYEHVSYSEGKARAMISMLLPTGGILVAEVDDVVVGMAAAFVVEHFFSTDRYAADLVVYVLPEFRGSTTAMRLVRAVESWAAVQGAKEIVLGVSTEIETDRTTALYEHLGYRESGRSLIKHV
jgi:GNAT superfamily N-acetyltransferase